MHFVYIDESHEGGLHAYAALLIEAANWRACFDAIQAYRRELKASDGIYIRKELHAWKFVSGRGKISERIVTKGRRCDIFRETLHRITGLPGIRLMNCVDADPLQGFERLLNRINRNMQAAKSHAVLFCDEGNEVAFTRMVRKMSRYNPVQSMFRRWEETGEATKNIPTQLILEDPVFKKSEESYFIQLADFCAYALLRKEVPLASKVAYGLDENAFAILHPICVLEAHPRDKYGIIR